VLGPFEFRIVESAQTHMVTDLPAINRQATVRCPSGLVLADARSLGTATMGDRSKVTRSLGTRSNVLQRNSDSSETRRANVGKAANHHSRQILMVPSKRGRWGQVKSHPSPGRRSLVRDRSEVTRSLGTGQMLGAFSNR
jgi:hypothetical protein